LIGLSSIARINLDASHRLCRFRREPRLTRSRHDQRFLLVAPLDQGARTPITLQTNWEASLKHN
jgi:hypothetical protein